MKLIKFFAAAAFAVVLAASCNNTPKPVDGVNPPTAALKDSADYCLCVFAANAIAGQGMINPKSELNMAQVVKGIEDFLAAMPAKSQEEFEAHFKISPSQMWEIVNNYRTQKDTYDAAAKAKAAKDFLSKNALKATVDTLESGLQYEILAEGSSEKITVNDTLLVNYKGSLLDGEVLDQADSASFPLSGLVEGWKQGLSLVGEGAKVKLYIPANLGYGNNPRHHLAKEMLIFDIEVLKVNKFVPVEE